MWPTTQPERKDKGGKEGVKFGLVVEIERQETDGAPLVVLRSPLQVGLCWYHTWIWSHSHSSAYIGSSIDTEHNLCCGWFGCGTETTMYVCKSDLSVLVFNL